MFDLQLGRATRRVTMRHDERTFPKRDFLIISSLVVVWPARLGWQTSPPPPLPRADKLSADDHSLARPAAVWPENSV